MILNIKIFIKKTTLFLYEVSKVKILDPNIENYASGLNALPTKGKILQVLTVGYC